MAIPPVLDSFGKNAPADLGEGFYQAEYAFTGVKTGYLKIVSSEIVEPKTQTVQKSDQDAEINKFWLAYEQTVQEIENRNKVYDNDNTSEEAKEMLKTVTSLSRGRATDEDIRNRNAQTIPSLFRNALNAITTDGKSASYAAYDLFTRQSKTFETLPAMEHLSPEINDILKIFLRKYDPANQPSAGLSFRGDDIIIAKNMSPGDIADLLDEEGNPIVKGVILDKSTITSHAVIACKAAGLLITWFTDGKRPQNLRDGMRVVMDGDEKTVLFNANNNHWKTGRTKEVKYDKGYDRLLKKAHERRNPESRDQREFKICINGDAPATAHGVQKYNAHSMGLIRLESYVASLPKFQRKLTVEQCREYILEMLDISNRSNMTFRLMDATEDKVIEGLNDEDIAKIDKNFMTAFLQIRKEMPQKKIHVMVPLVLKPEDLENKQLIMDFTASTLGIDSYRLGSMAEDPEFLDNLEAGLIQPSFISVGTNDMTASTLKIGRFDQKDAGKNDPTHPDVLRNIFRVIEHQRRQGGAKLLPVSVCGDMASQPENFAILAGMGVRRISVAGAISPVIKELAANIDTGYRFWELQGEDPHQYAIAEAKAQKDDNPTNAWALYQRLSVETHREVRIQIRNTYNKKYLGLDEHQKIMPTWQHPDDNRDADNSLDND